VDENQSADRELNLMYNRVQQVLAPDEQGQIRAAERLWIQFRDADCTAERSLYGNGSTAPAVYFACMVAETRQRTTELKVMYGWRLEKFGK